MNEGICFYLVSYTRTIMDGFFLLYYLFYSLIHDVQTNEPQERMLNQLSGRIRHRVQNIQSEHGLLKMPSSQKEFPFH